VLTERWRWHVQRLGADPRTAPWLLLLHGTGGSTHEWADVARALASQAHVLLCDLPGHGFTTARHSNDTTANQRSPYSLVGMTDALCELLRQLVRRSECAAPPLLYVAGHSAGAAVALQLPLPLVLPLPLPVEMRSPSPTASTRPAATEEATAFAEDARMPWCRVGGLVGVNPALVPPPAPMLEGILPWLAPLMSSRGTRDLLQVAQRGLSAVPGLGGMQEAIGQMALNAILDSTGSPLTEASRRAYRRLFAEPRHVWSALQMMAHWGLPALIPRLADVRCPVTLLVARDDPWIPVRALVALHRQHPAWTFRETTGGHLLPETSAELVARVIAEQCFLTKR
jgi:magnesium chelatase accessory protein